MFLRKIIFVLLLTSFSTIVIVYGVYKATPIILGPGVEITSVKNGEIVNGTNVTIKGNVLRAKSLYINNIPTTFDENGSFETKLAIYPGSNILAIDVEDRFGRVKSKIISLGTN